MIDGGLPLAASEWGWLGAGLYARTPAALNPTLFQRAFSYTLQYTHVRHLRLQSPTTIGQFSTRCADVVGTEEVGWWNQWVEFGPE